MSKFRACSHHACNGVVSSLFCHLGLWVLQWLINATSRVGIKCFKELNTNCFALVIANSGTRLPDVGMTSRLWDDMAVTEPSPLGYRAEVFCAPRLPKSESRHVPETLGQEGREAFD